MRFYSTLILFLLMSSLTARAQENHALTLEQCLDIAIKNNLSVKQSNNNMEVTRIGLMQAKENLLPAISGSASRTLNQGRGINTVTNTYVNQSQTSDNYGLSGSLMVFNGLSYQNAIKQASLDYQAGKMDYQAAKDVVMVNVITNYLLILNNQEQLNQTKNQLTVAKEQLDRSGTLEKQGANKAASDFYDLKGAYSGSQVTVVNAQNSLNSARLSLFQLMGVAYDADATFQTLNAGELSGQNGGNADSVYQTALQQLALVKAAALKRESAEKAVKVAQGQLLPTLSLNGGLSTNYSNVAQRSIFTDSVTSAVPGLYTNGPAGRQSIFNTQANYAQQNISYGDQLKNNYGSYAQLTLSIPLFTNQRRKNNVALARINLLNAQYVEENTRIQLRQNIEQAWYNMTAAYNKYQALDDQVKSYAESFRISKLRFEAGVLTSVDYIIAKNNLDAANLNLISARYDYFIYSKILDYYRGRLSL